MHGEYTAPCTSADPYACHTVAPRQAHGWPAAGCQSAGKITCSLAHCHYPSSISCLCREEHSAPSRAARGVRHTLRRRSPLPLHTKESACRHQHACLLTPLCVPQLSIPAGTDGAAAAPLLVAQPCCSPVPADTGPPQTPYTQFTNCTEQLLTQTTTKISNTTKHSTAEGPQHRGGEEGRTSRCT